MTVSMPCMFGLFFALFVLPLISTLFAEHANMADTEAVQLVRSARRESFGLVPVHTNSVLCTNFQVSKCVSESHR